MATWHSSTVFAISQITYQFSAYWPDREPRRVRHKLRDILARFLSKNRQDKTLTCPPLAQPHAGARAPLNGRESGTAFPDSLPYLVFSQFFATAY
jgi:hypothetical protein